MSHVKLHSPLQETRFQQLFRIVSQHGHIQFINVKEITIIFASE